MSIGGNAWWASTEEAPRWQCWRRSCPSVRLQSVPSNGSIAPNLPPMLRINGNGAVGGLGLKGIDPVVWDQLIHFLVAFNTAVTAARPVTAKAPNPTGPPRNARVALVAAAPDKPPIAAPVPAVPNVLAAAQAAAGTPTVPAARARNLLKLITEKARRENFNQGCFTHASSSSESVTASSSLSPLFFEVTYRFS